jgi:hypothetical protein
MVSKVVVRNAVEVLLDRPTRANPTQPTRQQRQKTTAFVPFLLPSFFSSNELDGRKAYEIQIAVIPMFWM